VSGTQLQFSEWQQQLFAALVEAEEANPHTMINLAVAAEALGYAYSPAWLRKAANLFEARGWITAEYFIGGDVLASVTGDGMLHYDTIRVPASDRFVAINHNSAAYVDAVEKLEATATALDQANDLLIAQDEKESLIAEVRSLLNLLKEKVVRLAVLVDATTSRGILGSIRKNFPSDVRSALVGAAVAALLALIGLG
jgi:hypothetical protein